MARARTEVTEIRLGGRNYLRVGDPVRVLPSKPGRRDGFVGIACRIDVFGNGDPAEVTVYGAPGQRVPSTRVLVLGRLARVERSTAATHQRAVAS